MLGCGRHLGYQIDTKNSNLVQDHPRTIPVKQQFKWPIDYGGEDFSNFSQSERIISPGGHVLIPIGTKNTNFVEDHPSNIPAKFGSIWPSGFRGED